MTYLLILILQTSAGYAIALLLVMIVAGLVACESAGDDPAQRVEKPMPVTATKE